MDKSRDGTDPIPPVTHDAPDQDRESTLVPMLIGGLVSVVIGMLVVIAFI